MGAENMKVWPILALGVPAEGAEIMGAFAAVITLVVASGVILHKATS